MQREVEREAQRGVQREAQRQWPPGPVPPAAEHRLEVSPAASPAPIGVVAVGFSPAEPLAALAEALGWVHPFLSDPQRTLYHRLGLRRAGLLRTYSPGTLLRYGRAVVTGARLHRPVEDPRQLGGDALVRDGVVVRSWRPRTPSDRVSAQELVAAARRTAATPPPTTLRAGRYRVR